MSDHTHSISDNIGSLQKEDLSDKLTDAIIKARKLVCPTPVARHTHQCDHDYHQFWRKNDKLIKQAWKDYPFKHEELRYFNHENEQLFIQKDFYDAVSAVIQGEKNEETLRLFFDETIPGVYRTNKIFTSRFLDMMLEEIDHKNEAGIPLQRPNSMNRFGVILKVSCKIMPVDLYVRKIYNAFIHFITLRVNSSLRLNELDIFLFLHDIT